MSLIDFLMILSEIWLDAIVGVFIISRLDEKFLNEKFYGPKSSGYKRILMIIIWPIMIIMYIKWKYC